MAPKQGNPTRRDREARAPYNFVPLGDRVVIAERPIPHDRYLDQDESGEPVHTGWIDCTLETCSPTYVRGMLTIDQWRRAARSSDLSPEDKTERAGFFNLASGDEDDPEPIIPGSSLRGMVRGLVEIASFGRIRWVTDEHRITFRAVAARREDPLRQPYEDALGRFGRNVRAGYLLKKNGAWHVWPSLAPNKLGLPGRDTYLKVKERHIPRNALPGFVRFDDPEYRPQVHYVSFNVEAREGRTGRAHAAVTGIGPVKIKMQHRGCLVCSGNMLETAADSGNSPRKNHALVLDVDPRAQPIPIPQSVIEDYRSTLTDFERDQLGAWSTDSGMGCLAVKKPVFFVERGGQVLHFGHCPNFRIVARPPGHTRAATPRTFLPDAHALGESPDMADAIFGWVTDNREGESPIFGDTARAGRISVSNARFIDVNQGALYSSIITPHVLSSPKPTTFQHYLVQDPSQRHNPDQSGSLAHFGTPVTETVIRGHKFYWHRDPDPADLEASEREREHEDQLTRIRPLRTGVRFAFRVSFENLRSSELGAVLWALKIPGEPGRTYRHHIGMGKPLGMGSVAIEVDGVTLTDRAPTTEDGAADGRYERLFTAELDWHRGDRTADDGEIDAFVTAFEQYVHSQGGTTSLPLRDDRRIKSLLAMLEWRPGSRAWWDLTRYMEIEHGAAGVNEYDERPVLPEPDGVLKSAE